MAGEWLKFDSTLPEKPETLAITIAMGWDDPDLTVGKLMRLFRWFDQQTTDGNALSVTPALLDRIVGAPGFVLAVAAAGWIVVENGSISLAKFDRHNGVSAKSRAQTAKRVAAHKANAGGNADAVTGALPREEKRREEEPPNGGSTHKRATPLPKPEDVEQQTWDDWTALRRRKKADASATTVDGARREAGKAGMSLEAFLRVWCLRGSQGLQADWLKPEERARGSPHNGHKHAAAARAIFGDLDPHGEVVDV